MAKEQSTNSNATQKVDRSYSVVLVSVRLGKLSRSHLQLWSTYKTVPHRLDCRFISIV